MSKQKGKRSVRRSRLSRQILWQYALALVVFVGLCFAILLLGMEVVSQITWYGDSFFYPLLRWMRNNIAIWGGAVLVAGWAVLTYIFISRPLRYIDEIVDASNQLAQPDEITLTLSPALKSVQDEMNLVRERALRNALAAKEAEQRKNDLVVYLAHDLKTPLTSVIGYLNLLQDEPDLSQEVRSRYTGIAVEKAQRLEYLINEFFEITRFSLTHLTLEPERVNLSRMLEQIVYEFNPILGERQLLWNVHLAPDVWIICDPDKLERVMDNLIRNAISYSYPGTEISLSLHASTERVTLQIRNQGKTIPPEKLERLFEQFFRLDSARGSSTGGVGLGLAIAKEIVQLHGGSIRAESENETVAFTVQLPLDCQEIVRNSP